MTNISQIEINNTTYDIADAQSRNDINNLTSLVSELRTDVDNNYNTLNNNYDTLNNKFNNYLPLAGGNMTGNISWNGAQRLYWKEGSYGDQFAIQPAFSGADDTNLLQIQGAVGNINTSPALYNLITVSGKSGNVWIKGNVTASNIGNVAAINKNNSTSNYLRGDGQWVTPPDNNTTYGAVSTSANGLCTPSILNIANTWNNSTGYTGTDFFTMDTSIATCTGCWVQRRGRVVTFDCGIKFSKAYSVNATNIKIATGIKSGWAPAGASPVVCARGLAYLSSSGLFISMLLLATSSGATTNLRGCYLLA